MPADRRPDILIVMADQMVPSALPFHGNPVTKAPAHVMARRVRGRLRRGVHGQPAVLARAGVLHDRPAALAHARLRQRGGVQLGHPHVRPLPAQRRATGPSCPARCTSAAPTSCTGSRSGSPPTSIPRTTGGRPTGTARTTGRPGTTTCRRCSTPGPASGPTSSISTTRSRSPPNGRSSAICARATNARSATWSRSAIRTTRSRSRGSGGTSTATRTSRCPPHGYDEASLHPHERRLREVCAMNGVEVTEDHIRAARRAYYGAISYVDDHISRLIGVLRDTGRLDRTVIIVTSDHGEMLGERGAWYKMSFYEGSARVPLIVRAPGAVPRRAGWRPRYPRWTCCRRWPAWRTRAARPASSARSTGGACCRTCPAPRTATRWSRSTWPRARSRRS